VFGSGDEVGRGVGKNKNDAGTRAAIQALKNSGLLEPRKLYLRVATMEMKGKGQKKMKIWDRGRWGGRLLNKSLTKDPFWRMMIETSILFQKGK
jgi:hypothetical protein